MNRPAARRLSQKQVYGPACNKNLRGILRKELLTNFGFEHMFLMADVLIDRFLAIIEEADILHGPLEPFQTVIYGYDKLKRSGPALRRDPLDLARRWHVTNRLPLHGAA